MLVADEFFAIRKLGEDVVQTGNDKDAQQRAHEHAADGGGANGAVANGAGTRSADERNEASDERERCHGNRPESELRAFDARVPEAQTLLAALDGEFDN